MYKAQWWRELFFPMKKLPYISTHTSICLHFTLIFSHILNAGRLRV